MSIGAYKHLPLAQSWEQPWPPRQHPELARLRAMVLLAGAVRPSPLRRSVGRFVLELPLAGQRNLFQAWQEQAMTLCHGLSLSHLPVRVMIDHGSPHPRLQAWEHPTELYVERDPLQFRGTGGLLHDLARPYGDDEWLLVADAAQVQLEPLAPLVAAMASSEGDVRLLSLPDGTPGGAMLLRCGVLRDIARIGFIDFKEQALPAIARDREVVVCGSERRFGAPVRTREEYLAALRRYHCRDDASRAEMEGRPSFRLVEPGAAVHPSAVLHDAVVLAGSRVEAGAVVARSVVCPGASVGEGEKAIDRLVVADERA
ncbi:MAG: hypothetical protein ACLFVN_08090 [Phycisphaeraceae bacterium]